MRRFALLLLPCGLLFSSPAAAADPDPWFGSDKALHFGVSAAISGGVYAISATQFESRTPPLLLGAGVSLAAGAGKELADLAGAGDPSWKDFAWDAIGTVVGLGVAYSIDLLARGVSDRHPALGSPQASVKGLTIAF